MPSNIKEMASRLSSLTGLLTKTVMSKGQMLTIIRSMRLMRSACFAICKAHSHKI